MIKNLELKSEGVKVCPASIIDFGVETDRRITSDDLMSRIWLSRFTIAIKPSIASERAWHHEHHIAHRWLKGEGLHC